MGSGWEGKGAEGGAWVRGIRWLSSFVREEGEALLVD